MEQSTTELASLAESWEEVAENPESLEKQLSKVKIMNRSSPESEALKQQPCQKQVTILSGDEQRRTQYVPETKLTIMKRPSQSASEAAAARPKAPLKTLEQRQAEYNEARIRILGNAEPVITDKSDSSTSTSSSVDAAKSCSPVAQGAQRGLITGPAARQQQQAKQQQQQQQQRHNKQNKRTNNINTNNNLVNHSNGSQLADQSRILQQPQQPMVQSGQGPQPVNVPVSVYNARVPQFYTSEGQAAMHAYQQQPPAFVPAHCYPPPMNSCQQFPTSMPAQQLAAPLSQQFTMPPQDFSLPVSPHQQYQAGAVTMGPYGAAPYLPHTVAGTTPGAVYSPYQHPYQCFPRLPYQLNAQPPMMPLHHPPHHHQQPPPLPPPTSFAMQQPLQPQQQVLPAPVEAQQLHAVQQQPRQKNKKQRNKKNESSNVGSDNSTSPTPAESRQQQQQQASGGGSKAPATATNGLDSVLLADAVGEASSSPPRGASPEEGADPTPMETVTKKKNKKKKKKAQAKTSPTNPVVTTGKTNGTLSSKEGNGRIIRMPRGPDGTKGFTLVR